jgi:hypothetical protein
MSEQIVMNAMFGTFTTGNPITDIALRTLILTAITAVMNWFTTKLDFMNLYNDLRNYFFKQKKYPEIIMEAESVDVMMAGKKVSSKMNYSKGFLAILHYINAHPELNIRVFKETSAFNEARDKDTYFSRGYECDEKERLKKLNDKYYIPYMSDEFMLEPTMELMCHININMIKNIKNKDEASGKEMDSDKKIHQIQLYIKKGNMNDIQEFINKCIIIHEKYQESQLSDEQYFFNFRQCVELDGTIQAEWEEIKFTTNKTFDHVFFEKKDKLMKQIDFFMKNPDWYKKHGIPYHLGLLLYGTPGCGKTSTIKVIAQRTGYSIIVINLNRIKSSRELESIFYNPTINKKIIPNNKRIYVFEDIDCLSSVVLERSEVNSEASRSLSINSHRELDGTSSVNGDDNADNSIMKLASAIVGAQKGDTVTLMKDDSDKLSLSCLLNLLDGIIETPGRIVIMTSNYPERLDKALIRAGRIDISIELKKASKEIIMEILSNFFEIPVTTIQSRYESLLSQMDEYKYSPAEVCNYCVMNKTSIEDCLNTMIAK